MTRRANPELPKKILAEAEKIVVALGHEAINMRDIAKRVGVSATAIYHYFENKEKLLLKVKLQAAEKLNKRIRRIDPALTPIEAIHRLGEEYIVFAQEYPNLYRLLFETPIGKTPLGQAEHPVLYYTYYTARNTLDRMVETKTPLHDTRYSAMMGWIMLHGFCSLIMSGNLQLVEGMNREELRELFLRFYSQGGRPD